MLATALAVAKAINKQPVVARVCDGFIANRAFDTYWREAEFLVEEGASPYDVDKTLYDFGMPMGPFAVADLVGLDVGQLIRKTQRLKLPQGARVSAIEDAIVATGRLGQKSRGRLVQLRRQCALRRARSRDPGTHRPLPPGARFHPARHSGGGDHRALHLCGDQRRREGAGGRHRHPLLRHRRGRRLWLRISRLARWPDAICRRDRPAGRRRRGGAFPRRPGLLVATLEACCWIWPRAAASSAPTRI